MARTSRRKSMGWLFLASIVTGLGLVWAVGSVLTGPTNQPVPAFPLPAQSVFLNSQPGIKIAGTYWPANREDAPAVLLLHGNGGSRRDRAAMAQWLNGHGYAVMAIDFRGHGASTPSRKSFGLFEARDAHAAFDWLKARHEKGRIGVVAFSLGGASALLGKEGPLKADAFVLQAVYPDIRHAIHNRIASRLGWLAATVGEPLLSYQSYFRLGVLPEDIAPIKAIKHIDGAVLILGGTKDTSTPPIETKAMFAAAGSKASVAMLPGLTHDQDAFSTSAIFRNAVLAFLDAKLKPNAK